MKVLVKCFLINSHENLFIVKDDGFVYGHDENAGLFNIRYQAFIAVASVNDDCSTLLTQTHTVLEANIDHVCNMMK